MDWLTVITNMISRVPIERVFPRPDHTKALGEFASTMEAPIVEDKAPSEHKTAPTIQEPETVLRKETVATACVPCALGHVSTTTGLLLEAVRFKKEGLTSFEIGDRIGKCLAELNALERVDLTPEKIRSTPDWERDIAEEALQQSRGLRHRLETISTIEDLEQVAADTEGYYRRLNREWWKRRLTQTGKTEPELTLEDAKRMAAEAAEKENERVNKLGEKPATGR